MPTSLRRPIGEAEARSLLQYFTISLNIRKRLAESGPAHSGWQRNRSVSSEKLGSLSLARGDLAEVRLHLAHSFKIRERLSTAGPTNSQWQHDLWISLVKLGYLAKSEGNIVSAINHYRANLPIAAALAAQSPGMPQRRNDLANTRRRLAELEGSAAG